MLGDRKGRVVTRLKIIYQFHQNQRNVRKRRGRNIRAVMRDVPMMLLVEEFVSGTVPRNIFTLAVLKDVPIRYRMKEYV